jgi:hypothetical protein
MTGLVTWWPFHESIATVQDYGSAGNDGTKDDTQVDAAGRACLQATPFSNQPIDFGDVLDIQDIGGDRAMFCFWVRYQAVSSETVIHKGNSGDYSYNIRLDSSGSGGSITVRGWESGGANAIELKSGEVLSEDTWHHIAIYMEQGESPLLYVDGSFVTSGSTPGGTWNVNSAATLHVGIRGDDDTNPLESSLCDFRIYDRQLSPQEVQRLYEWGAGDYATPPDDNDGGLYYYEAQSDATDVWGGSDGTENGTVNYSIGVRGQAFDLPPSSSNYIDLGFSTQPVPSTISLWVNPRTISSNAVEPIYGNLPDEESTDAVSIHFYYSDYYGRPLYRLRYGNETSGLASIWSGWVNIVAILRDGEATLYSNGTKLTTISGPSGVSNIDNGTNMRLGAGAAIDGKIDEVRVYDRALSELEILDLYRHGTRGINMKDKLINAR